MTEVKLFRKNFLKIFLTFHRKSTVRHHEMDTWKWTPDVRQMYTNHFSSVRLLLSNGYALTRRHIHLLNGPAKDSIRRIQRRSRPTLGAARIYQSRFAHEPFPPVPFMMTSCRASRLSGLVKSPLGSSSSSLPGRRKGRP